MSSSNLTLGSLFDGIGGFPLAASCCGIEPLWASEIEPHCIEITKRQFPTMKHLGSITDIHGYDIPPVDIISFGSPCQDLSVAGKQTGLDGERSGLFLEAVRIIREMRCATNGIYPAYAIWENVPGAFSSNKGGILGEFSKRSQRAKFQYLNLENGQEAEWCDYSTVKSLGELSTPNIGEFPNVENVSILSSVLEVEVPEKYYLSPKACSGTLRRAEKRGKKLPPLLEAVLKAQALLTERPQKPEV